MKKIRLFLLLALVVPTIVAAQSSTSGLQPCNEDPLSEAEGTLLNSSSTRPKVKWEDGGSAPAPGVRGELQKYFETELFGGTVRGWLVIGIVEALATTQGSTELKVLEAKSSMTVNGQAKSHFVAGKRVKFLEYDYSVAKKESIVEGGYRSEGTMVCGRKRGEWKRFAPNGKLIEVCSYNDEDQLDGPWTSFHESNGAKETVGSYKNGKKNGTWETYYPNGQIKTRRDHDDFGLEHPYRAWHANGNLEEEGNYNYKGLPTGEWKTYREDGTLFQVTMHEVKGQPGAVKGFKSYGEKGELRQEGYWDASKQLEGRHTSFYPNGGVERSATYSAGRLNGPYKAYHPNGKLSAEGYYLEGAKQGLWKEYYEDGKQKSEMEFKQEAANGPSKSWHANGQLAAKGGWHEGKKSGTWETFTENGTRLSLSNYQNGLMVGPFQFWHTNGTLAESGEYNAANKLHGNYAKYYDDGKLQEVGVYQDGQRVGKWTTRDAKGKKKVVKY